MAIFNSLPEGTFPKVGFRFPQKSTQPHPRTPWIQVNHRSNSLREMSEHEAKARYDERCSEAGGVHNAVRNRPPWDHMGKLNQIEWANGVSGTGVKHKDHGRCYSDTSSLAFWIFLASFSHSQCGGRLLLVGSALAPRPPPGEASARPVAQWKKMRAMGLGCGNYWAKFQPKRR